MDSEISDNKDLTETFGYWLNLYPPAPNLNAKSQIRRIIGEIDRLLSDQINEIIHQPEFQDLEATWRGLYHLVTNTITSLSLKILIFPASKRDLLKDSERSLEFYQSGFFRLISRDAWDLVPFGLLLGIYEFGNSPQDLALLESLSHTAAANQTPFISAVSPELFQMNGFREFYEVRDFSKIFEQMTYSYYQKWRSIRLSGDSNFLGLCLPGILLRTADKSAKSFNFAEDFGNPNCFLFGNPAFAFALKITESFSLNGWLAEITGKQNGLIEDFPKTEVLADLDENKKISSAEIVIDERMTRQLSELGFICLSRLADTDEIYFLSARSVHLVANLESENTVGINKQWTHFHNLLTVSRFAHYLKKMAIENYERFNSIEEWQNYLNQWINQFVGSPCSAEKPLAEASINVEGSADLPDKPIRLIADIKPGYQLPEMILPMRVEIRPFFN